MATEPEPRLWERLWVRCAYAGQVPLRSWQGSSFCFETLLPSQGVHFLFGTARTIAVPCDPDALSQLGHCVIYRQSTRKVRIVEGILPWCRDMSFSIFDLEIHRPSGLAHALWLGGFWTQYLRPCLQTRLQGHGLDRSHPRQFWFQPCLWHLDESRRRRGLCQWSCSSRPSHAAFTQLLLQPHWQCGFSWCQCGWKCQQLPGTTFEVNYQSKGEKKDEQQCVASELKWNAACCTTPWCDITCRVERKLEVLRLKSLRKTLHTHTF